MKAISQHVLTHVDPLLHIKIHVSIVNVNQQDHFSYLHHGRDLGRITKCIRQPELFASNTKFFLVKCLSVKELPDKRFSAGDVAIHLHPRPTHRKELSCSNLRFHSFKQFWIILLAPRPLLRLEKKIMNQKAPPASILSRLKTTTLVFVLVWS